MVIVQIADETMFEPEKLKIYVANYVEAKVLSKG